MSPAILPPVKEFDPSTMCYLFQLNYIYRNESVWRAQIIVIKNNESIFFLRRCEIAHRNIDINYISTNPSVVVVILFSNRYTNNIP